MKKIVFIQKDDDSTYDPVSTFFANKKTNSIPKPTNINNKNTYTNSNNKDKDKFQKTNIKPTSKNTQIQYQQQSINQIVENANINPKNIKPNNEYQQKQPIQRRVANSAKKPPISNNINPSNKNNIQTSIGRKGQHLPYDKSKYEKLYNQNKKQQNIYDYNKKQKQEIPKRRIGPGKITNINSENNNNIGGSTKNLKKEQKNSTLQSYEYQNLNYPITNQDNIDYNNYNVYSQILQNRKKAEERPSHKKIVQKIEQGYYDQNQYQQEQFLNHPTNFNNTKFPNIANKNTSPQVNSKQKIIIQKVDHVDFNSNINTINSKENNQLKELKIKVKQLEKNEQQYKRKIEELQVKQLKLDKNDQKFTKLQKQHKNCTSQIKKLNDILKQKQQQFKKMLVTGNLQILSKDGTSTTSKQIKYNKRRQLLLQNQINQLKKTNRQLVSRIKNYKGGDLVQMASSKTKTQILNECIQPQYQFENNINVESIKRMESLCSRMIFQLQNYLTKKSSSKFYEWSEEQKYLQQLIKLFEEISIQCLINKFYQFDDSPQDQNILNTGWIYNQIDNYQKSLKPLIDNNDLAFAISQQNIQLINQIHTKVGQLKQYEVQLKTLQSNSNYSHLFNLSNDSFISNMTSINKNSPSKGKRSSKQIMIQQIKQKYEGYINTLKKVQNFNLNVIAHALSQNVLIRQLLTLKSKKIGQQIGKLKIKLMQLNQIVQIGSIGSKQAIILFIQENLDSLMIKVPQLQTNIKNLSKQFKKIADSSLSVKNQVII